MAGLLKKTKKITARRAVTVVLAAGIGALWAVSMLLTTWLTAQDIMNQLYEKNSYYGSRYGEIELGALDSLVTEGDPFYKKGKENPAFFNYTLHETAARGNTTYLPLMQDYAGYMKLKNGLL